MTLVIEPDGKYQMTSLGTVKGYMRHDNGDWFIFTDGKGGEDKFKIIVSDDILTMETEDDETPMKLTRITQ
jgi:hypothetical protein